MRMHGPIGVFDSGVGGTSIWKEIHRLMPEESTIYLADSKYAPYGGRTRDEIIALSVKNTELLRKQGAKLIVVACNTATTNAIGYLRANYDLPFIGIEPAIKPAALGSKTKVIGVLATKGTLASELFHQTAGLYANGISIVERVGEGLVPLIESGRIETEEMRDLLHSFIQPMVEQNIDHLVLGCTHYPYLIPLLRTILPETVKIIDSGAAVARHTKDVLEQTGLLAQKGSPVSHQFYTNVQPLTLARFLSDVPAVFEVSHLDF